MMAGGGGGMRGGYAISGAGIRAGCPALGGGRM